MRVQSLRVARADVAQTFLVSLSVALKLLAHYPILSLDAARALVSLRRRVHRQMLRQINVGAAHTVVMGYSFSVGVR